MFDSECVAKLHALGVVFHSSTGTERLIGKAAFHNMCRAQASSHEREIDCHVALK